MYAERHKIALGIIAIIIALAIIMDAKSSRKTLFCKPMGCVVEDEKAGKETSPNR